MRGVLLAPPGEIPDGMVLPGFLRRPADTLIADLPAPRAKSGAQM